MGEEQRGREAGCGGRHKDYNTGIQPRDMDSGRITVITHEEGNYKINKKYPKVQFVTCQASNLSLLT